MLFHYLLNKISFGKDVWDRILVVNNCWEWQGCITSGGYAKFKRDYLHRLMYELFFGNIPEGLEIDHLCRNRRCVNPIHLQAVTRRVNVLRGISLSAQQARRTHCIRGHPLFGLNLAKGAKGKRQCRICRNVSSRMKWKKHKERYNVKRRLTRLLARENWFIIKDK